MLITLSDTKDDITNASTTEVRSYKSYRWED